jgi:hypothetical protein
MKKEEMKKDLTEAEVNVYCRCKTQLKIHCNHDCINGTAWITTNN